MATQPISQSRVSVDEYLSMAFEHDCEYIDGVIQERPLGEFEHCFLQGFLCSIFFNHRTDWGITCLPEQRVQIAPSRYLIPDVAVLSAGAPRERFLTKPPLLVIEIQSPQDTLRNVSMKARDYISFGVAHIWVIDPGTRTAYYAAAKGLEAVNNGWLELPGTSIRVSLNEMFSELDRA
jgi:Uma2 family endonuclease